ncbi:phage virion morphogenesis protein [Halopseudomonas bauzanensis]|uniref:phage virion morphogenesis protein n=1 Tax=Halopseudomonas bauzanensis TaxID=653930 RepID=UPI003525015E
MGQPSAVSSDLTTLEDWAGALLARLEPGERRKLNQGIARDLRKSQQQRITAQRNPDGTPYTPRKSRKLRSKQGRVKRKMFTKLKAAKHLRLRSDASTIGIAFMSRTARLARVHQYGLRDRPDRNSPEVRYSKRELLGFSADDLDMVRDRLLNHLSDL